MTNNWSRRCISHVLSQGMAWATVPVFAAGMGSTIWLERRLGITASIENTMLLVGFGAFAVVGSILIAKRPGNPISWILATVGLMTGLFPAAETYAAYVMTTRGNPDPLAVFGVWANNVYWAPLLALTLIYLPLLFPDGRLPSPRWMPVAVIPGIALAGYVVLSVFTETLSGQNIDYQINNPIGIQGMPNIEEHPFFPLLAIGFLIGLLGAVSAVFVRFRRSSGAERQQLKWFLYAATPIPAFMVIDLFPLIGDIVFGLILIGLPVAIGVAILRYRLYDIDIIIRRTLVYSILTAALALFYFGGVAVLEGVLRTLSSQTRPSPVAIVLSTLAIAALFNPLRTRIQAGIDRRFYRRKYDAERTLQAFAAAVRDEVELEKLSSNLLGVVQETMQPESVSLWIREPVKRTLRIDPGVPDDT